MGNRTTLVLLVLAGALAALLVALPHLHVVDTSPIPPRPAAPVVAGSPPASEAALASPVELTELTETVDRPLFAEDRRPAVEAPSLPVVEEPIATVPSTPPAFELSAVVIDGDRRLALFRGATGAGESRRAEEGSEIDGWTLTAVRPDGVVLERGAVRHELALRTFRPPPAIPGAKQVPRAPRARGTDDEAEPADTLERRPRRPLRGPRRRSARRQPTQ